MLCFSYLQSPTLAILLSSQAQAQPSRPPQLLAMVMPPTPATAAGRPKTLVLIGRVETTTGVLPGAVVEVQSNLCLRAVTDADGFFHLTVPTTTGLVAVIASYAGYKDISASLVPGAMPAVLRLVVPHDIVLPRKQRLGACLRVAQKEIRQQLQQVHR